MLDRRISDKYDQLLILFLILALGIFLRFYGLEAQSLWNDELSSWQRSNFDSLFTVISKGSKPDFNPPGYQILLYFVEQYVGDSETILRLPSAISGIFSILVIFLIGRRLYSAREGLIGAALMAVLWAPIYYSQEARTYSLLLLFTLLATYFWIEILERLNKAGEASYYVILAYIIVATTAAYLHYYGVYLVALQGLGAVLFFLRKKGRALLYIFVIYTLILLAYLPWLPTALTQISILRPLPTPKPYAFLAYIRFLFNKSNSLFLLVLSLYAFLFLHIFYKVWKTRPHRKIKISLLSPDLLLTLWLIVPFAIVYITSIVSTPTLTNRNLIISLPAAYLLLARAITQLSSRPRYQAVITFVIVGMFLYHLIFFMGYYSRPHKEQFREAVGFIVNHNNLYKNSLVIGYAWSPDYLHYYFEKKGSNQKVNAIAGQVGDIPLALETINIENPEYVWYIRVHRHPAPEFIDFLYQNLNSVDHQTFNDADVWLFETR